MSAYNGRRGPNVSQYIANLNTIPSEQEIVTEPQHLEADFSLFMNTDFLNLDVRTGDVDLTSPLDFDLDVNSPQANSATRTNSDANNAVEPKMEFNLNGDFQFADFANFSTPIVDPSIQSLPHGQPGNYSAAPTFTSPTSSATSPVAEGFDQSNDDSARNAAEEDKRRRNTAASARFRIKKKQREQALEKTAKEMTERVTLLETRISQLETENTWLKSLITEKNGGKTSSSEIRAMLNKHEENNAERSSGNRTDGVGTKSQSSKA